MNHTEEWEKSFDERFCIDYTPWGMEEEIRGMNTDINPIKIKDFIKSLLSTQREDILAKVDKIPVPHLYVNGEMIPDANFLSNRELIKQSLKEEGK